MVVRNTSGRGGEGREVVVCLVSRRPQEVESAQSTMACFPTP